MKRCLTALNAKEALIRLVQASHDLYQGALARSVLTHQRVHFAWKELQTHAFKNRRGSERLMNVEQFDRGCVNDYFVGITGKAVDILL